ncbi:MAG: hypothetical protein A2Y17_00540 [Clostridiales bacterium GWF2_38_85]|nr:MAG: hypothetical protein A2Y17_00540 [Clostridiales bacterium GWF2_38_85]
MTGKIIPFPQNVAVADPITQIIGNIPSIYALMPMEYDWQSYMSYGHRTYIGSGYIYDLDGVCTDYNSTINKYNQNLTNWNAGLMESVNSHQQLLFPNNNHITNYVNSYYIVGDGISTVHSLEFYSDLTPDSVFSECLRLSSNDGDDTVPVRSATINGNINTDRIYYKYSTSTMEANHTKLIEGSDDKKTLYFISEIINGNSFSYTSYELQAIFGIYKNRQ